MSSIPEIIKIKADKGSLTKDQIKTFITAVYNNTVDDSQIGAFLMAVYTNGMSSEETAELTHEMMNYGDRLDWSEFKEWNDFVVDKHSTGGVGDKISLFLAPALAACGVRVPMISGRGLGFTGGTLDKLEAVVGYKVQLPMDTMKKMVGDVGFFIAGQTKNLAPVDKKLYAIRDSTGTVESLPLIVGSIMSKKAVEGLKALILDVKVGEAAVMKTEKDARDLAQSMIEVGTRLGIQTIAVLSLMINPIGRCIGNALEVIDALWVLNGNATKDMQELVEELGAHLLHSAGIASDVASGRGKIREVLKNGQALKKFCGMLKGQGVDPKLADKLCQKGEFSIDDYLPMMGRKVPKIQEVKAKKTGIIVKQDALQLAEMLVKLGAGRSRKEDELDYEAGIHLLKKVGDSVNEGDVWTLVYHNKDLPADFNNIMDTSIDICPKADSPDNNKALIIDIMHAKEEN